MDDGGKALSWVQVDKKMNVVECRFYGKDTNRSVQSDAGELAQDEGSNLFVEYILASLGAEPNVIDLGPIGQ